MKLFRWLNLIILTTFLSACASGGGLGNPTSPTDVPLPTAIINITPAPDPSLVLTHYLEAYKTDDYTTMYSLLSKVTQDTISLDDFTQHNSDALNEMSANTFDYEVMSSLVNPFSAEIAYKVTYHTSLVGDIQRDIIARFVMENGAWKLQWDDSLILPELAG